MSKKEIKVSQKINSLTSIDLIHEQMDSNPHYPFNVQSGWLPNPNSPMMKKFFDRVFEALPQDFAPSVQALDTLVTKNVVLTYLMDNACQENGNIKASNLEKAKAVHLPLISSKEVLLNAFNALLNQPPSFIDDELVGLPFSAIVVGIDPTQSGMTLFRLPIFNKAMKAILNDWHAFLDSKGSNTVFSVEGEQWLSTKAKQQYQFEVWKKDNEQLPYWNTWNSFFTRQFKKPNKSRPIADQNSNKTIVSANDGSLFRWDENILAKDVFWFKDMQYSLVDILGADSLKEKPELLDLFTDGSIFQTYLNPYNYHRWWCPVNGEVFYGPNVISGDYFNKLVIPDFGGATTASLPYLVQVNARGLLVLKTDDGHGYVCCIPLGMSEVSTISFNKEIAINKPVKKGQEMGMFEYGGSSFVMIFQKLPGKKLFFQSGTGEIYEKRPVLPKGSASIGGNVTLIGSQIGKWQDVDFTVESTEAWQNTGYVNTGKQYIITYIGGLWTANPQDNQGNLYDGNGSSIVADQTGYPLQNQPEGALIGRIGSNPPFLIGNGPITTPLGQTGQLKLCINDDLNGLYGKGLTDNEGAITVSITPFG